MLLSSYNKAAALSYDKPAPIASHAGFPISTRSELTLSLFLVLAPMIESSHPILKSKKPNRQSGNTSRDEEGWADPQCSSLRDSAVDMGVSQPRR
jgi:hypothetical protein